MEAVAFIDPAQSNKKIIEIMGNHMNGLELIDNTRLSDVEKEIRNRLLSNFKIE